jgi:actin-related protein 8
MAAEFKIYRRNNKRRVLPNSRELVVNWNTRNDPETISEHNDPMHIDWTEIPSPAPEYFTGQAAMRIPEKSRPRYKLSWPWQYGQPNERDYKSKNLLYRDFFLIIEEAIKTQLGLARKKDWAQYSCVFIIPDLYEKLVVSDILHEMLRDFGFQRVCFMQESVAATFGAGYSISCIVDIGAQKTSVCCVDEGMCVENSRVNLKYGGEDVTEAFIKMMLFDHLNYADMNLQRRHDYLLAEELKQKFCTLADEHISVQLYEFHLRASGQDTRKYQFKTYDEVMLAPMVCSTYPQ